MNLDVARELMLPKLERAKALGYESFWYERMSKNIAFADLERPGAPENAMTHFSDMRF